MLTSAEWSPEMAADLARIEDPSTGVNWLRREVAEGRLHGLAVTRAGRPVCHVLYRIEDVADGVELMIAAAGGREPGIDLTASLLPGLEALARRAGATHLRFHTRRPGLVRRAGRLGYRTAEIIMRKAVSDGQ